MLKNVLIAAAIIVAIGAGVFVYQKSKQPATTPEATPTTEPAASPDSSTAPTEGSGGTSSEGATGALEGKEVDVNAASDSDYVSATGSQGQTSKDQAAKNEGTTQPEKTDTSIISKGTTPGTSSETKTAQAPQKSEPNCYSFQYQHKASAKNRDIEDFLDYSNGFAIDHENFNPKTLCVKVNSKPVKFTVSTFQGKKEVLLGSIVGPESVIHVSYCTGKASCKESCEIKKSRALDQLLSDDDDSVNFGDSWDTGSAEGKEKSAQQKKKLEAQAKEMRKVASQNEGLNKVSVMRDWQVLKSNESVCKK